VKSFRSFPVFRVKYIRDLGRKPMLGEEKTGYISSEFKLQDKSKHMVIVVLGMVDETAVLTEDWVTRAIAALHATSTDKPQT